MNGSPAPGLAHRDGPPQRPVFDRMFSLGVRGSGTDTAPLGARVAAVAGSATSGPRRHFLYCSLHSESAQRSKRSREQS